MSRARGAKVPAAQRRHAVHPAPPLNAPAAHGAQPDTLLSPATAPKVPAGQRSMRLPPPQYAPRGHASQRPDTHVVRPASGAVLGGQARQAPTHGAVGGQ